MRWLFAALVALGGAVVVVNLVAGGLVEVSATGADSGRESPVRITEDVSVPESANVYGLDRRALQNRTETVQGDLNFDLELAAFYSEELCNYLAGEVPRTFSDAGARGSLPGDALSTTSYGIVDRFRAGYCNGLVDVQKPVANDIVARAAEAAAAQGGRGARAVADAIAAVEAPGSADVEAVRQELEAVILTTASPGVLMHANELLASDDLGGFLPDGFDAGMLDADERYIVSLFGGQLAACTLAMSCRQPTFFSIRACLPGACRGSGSMLEYIRGRLSPTQLDAAERYAKALLDMRLAEG